MRKVKKNKKFAGEENRTPTSLLQIQFLAACATDVMLVMLINCVLKVNNVSLSDAHYEVIIWLM